MKTSLCRPFLAVALLLWTQSVLLQGQEPIKLPEGVPPESEWAYSKHLEQVEEIMKNSNLAQREEQLETFMKKLHPKSKILQYYESFFSRTAADYEKAGQAQQANALRAKMSDLFPDSTASLAQSLQGALAKKDYATAIQLGEKLYASNPDPQTATVLAHSYIATGNNPAKAAEYSQKALEAQGPKEGVYFVYYLAQYYTSQNNLEQALTYYDQMLKAYPQGTPEGWDSTQWNNAKATAHSVRGSAAYVKKDFQGAITSYLEALKYAPQNDSAHLYIGLSHWRLQQLDEATAAFAKAVVLGKASSAKAREYLEQIYKPRNNNSLEGLDGVLDQARKELNL